MTTPLRKQIALGAFAIAALWITYDHTGPVDAEAAPPAAEMDQLRVRVDQLKALLPDQAHAMADVGQHFSGLWFAAQNGNWDLADFYLLETRSHLKWAVNIRPVRQTKAGDVDLRGILESIDNSFLSAIKKAVDEKDTDQFETAYRQTIEGCYSCHKASEKPFLRLRIPDVVGGPIIDFKPDGATLHASRSGADSATNGAERGRRWQSHMLAQRIQHVLATQAPAATVLIRVSVGLIFVSEGLQKFMYPDAVGAGRFASIGFDSPEFLARFVGTVETVCGGMVLLGIATRCAAAPLIAIMVVAIVSTKLPILLGEDFLGFHVRKLSNYGFWAMAHEARTDWAMLLNSIYLLIVGGGAASADAVLARRSAGSESQ